MKIHFSAAVDGDQVRYAQIVKIIQDLGHTLITDHYLVTTIENIKRQNGEEGDQYLRNVQKWNTLADIVVFEVSKSDISTGYEIGFALQLQKQVVVLVGDDQPTFPHTLKTLNNLNLQIIEYNSKNLKFAIEQAIDYANSCKNIRFNFMLSSELNAYLTLISEKKKSTKSEFLRSLLIGYRNKHS